MTHLSYNVVNYYFYGNRELSGIFIFMNSSTFMNSFIFINSFILCFFFAFFAGMTQEYSFQTW